MNNEDNIFEEEGFDEDQEYALNEAECRNAFNLTNSFE